VQAYAEQVIQELRDRFQTNTAKAPPHITLQAPFDWPAARLDELNQCLCDFADSRFPIPVLISGFAAFAPRVLFMNVRKTADLLKTQAELAETLEKTLQIVDFKSKHRSFSPHITVASRHLTPSLFKTVWAELQSRSIEFEFIGDRLSLIVHNGQAWEIQTEFPLQITPERQKTQSY
jgi:2'-5' RNA ligase